MLSRHGKCLMAVLFSSSSFLIGEKRKGVFCENVKVEKVFLFGDKRSLLQTTKPNGETPFFESNHLKVQKISFGNGIGGCIANNGKVYIWGSYKAEGIKELCFVDPFELKVNEKYKDIQFSEDDIYLLTRRGELKIIRNYKKCLQMKQFEVETFYKGEFGFFRTGRVVKLSVNKHHLGFVTDKGEVFCSGNNSHGQCGIEPPLKDNMYVNFNFDFLNNLLGNEGKEHTSTLGNRTSVVTVEQENKKNESCPKKEDIEEIAFQKNATINDNGKHETNRKGDLDNCDKVTLNKIKFKDRVRIVDISCGLNHTLCVDDKHNIYSFGDDSKIQLGLGESRTNKNTLTGTKWKDQIKFGYSSLTTNLANYSFFDRHLKGSPEKVLKKINDIEMLGDVYKINAGLDFSVIFSNDKLGKQLFCFGDNTYFQCGRNLGKHQQTLSTIRLPANDINDFSCGNRHCLINIKNKIYGWGYNNMSQISPFKNKGIINNPVNIFLYDSYPMNIHVKYLDAKYDNSAVVVETVISKEMLLSENRRRSN